MSDLQKTWDPWLLTGDWIFTPPDLMAGRDLEGAAINSLFTDRLALADDRLPDPQDGDRRGWWADWDSEEGFVGSRLWLISREKATEETRLKAEDYCREALAWMLEDDVADDIQITAAWADRPPSRLDVDVVITRERRVLLHRNFSWAWQQIYPGSPQPPIIGARPPRPPVEPWDSGEMWDSGGVWP